VIKRTIEISAEPAFLSVKNDQLLVNRGEAVAGSIPCEDIGMVVVDHPQAGYSHGALSRLAEFGAVVVICGRNHMPQALLLPMADHTEVAWRLREQIEAAKPVQKRIWRQIVRAKILGQAANLSAGGAARRKLARMADEVRSGDPENMESQAARLYWSAWLMDPNADDDPQVGAAGEGGVDGEEGAIAAARAWLAQPAEAELERFRRDTDGDGLNALLNYGYAIIRASVARAIVSAGLHPALGIQHKNRSNAFCLADDLMEPLRPMVDRRARALWWAGARELDRATKQGLLELVADEVAFGDESGPLMVVLPRYVASFVRCLRREADELETPRLSIPRSPRTTDE
jgi:CRISPR-associated protein Cas1